MSSERLVYFVDAFPSISETFIVNEAESMALLGVDVTIFSIFAGEIDGCHDLSRKWLGKTVFLDRWQAGRLGTVVAALRWFLRAPGRCLSLLWSLRTLDADFRWTVARALRVAHHIADLRPDHIHAHFASENAKYAWIISRLIGCPFSISMHGFDIYVAPLSCIGRLARDAAFVRSVCEYNHEAMVALGIDVDKIKLVHCGVWIDKFNLVQAPARKILYDIICVARLHPVKGLINLIGAIEILHAEGIDLVVAIVGAGPEELSLKRAVERAGLVDQVLFLGAKNQDAVQNLLLESAIFCLPSLGDSVGVATMEAMATGLPVISTDIKGIPELVLHGVTGFLVPPGNAVILAKTIQRLMADEFLRTSMGAAGRCRIEACFDQRRQAEKLINYLFNDNAARHHE